MTFSSDINADPENVDVKVVFAFFVVMLIFMFWFAMGVVFIFRAKVVVAFHLLLHLL
ncbi:hypothetical protein [Sutcliffiella horikoshii]|uniref:hypothetical protein n=1 Tax=Sutcliffiella horikoshii TaxID=79883 RepID=UPI001653717E|nr:hypothetical protein [Sutcliffiella horikoshii]